MMISMAIPTVALIESSLSYVSRMLRIGVWVPLFGVCLCTIAAHAQDATWFPNPGSGDWNTATNWTPSTVPTVTATFGASSTTTISFSNSASIQTLQFNAAAPSYSFSLSNFFSLTITGTGIVNNSVHSPTFSAPVSAGTLSFANGSTAGNATIVEGATLGVNFNNTSTAGTATITNSGAHTYFNDASTAGSATITNNGGLTGFFGTSTAGTATIISNGNGGRAEFFGTSTGGQARLIANLGGVANLRGVFDMSFLTSNGMTAGSIEGAGSFLLGSKAFTVGLNNLSTEVSGTISDGGLSGGTGGALIKVGTGTLTLIGANAYTGGTTINAGVLQIGNGGASGSILGDVTNDATLAFNHSGSVTFGGTISGTGALVQLGSGTLILAGINTYEGATTVSMGTLAAGSTTAFSPHSAFTVFSVLELNGKSNSVGSLAGNGTVTNNGSALATLTAGGDNTSTTFSGSLVDGTARLALNKTGTGTLTLSGTGAFTGLTDVQAGVTAANTYTGGTTISGGTLQIGDGGVIGSIVGNVLDNGVLAFDRSDSVTFAGNVNGGGSLKQIGSGILTLTGDNVYTGATIVSTGTLQAGSPTALSANSDFTVNSVLDLNGNSNVIGSLAGGGTVTNNGGTLARLTAGGDGNSTGFSGTLTDGAAILGLIKNGFGTLTLTGANAYTGGTTINAGVLQIGNGGASGNILGDVTNDATLAFNHSGSVTFGGMISGTGALVQLAS